MKQKRIQILIFIVLILFQPLFGRGYKVLRIVDGDTFDIDINCNGKIDKNERVRLLGIDCFESTINEKLQRQARRWNLSLAEAHKKGIEATNFARKHLLKQFVELEYSGKRKGYFGRILAYVNNGGEDFASLLLENKLAFVYNKNSEHKKYQEYIDKEKLRLQSSSIPEKPISWKYAHQYVGRYITVEGQINQTFDTGEISFLNFHPDYKKYISGVIFKSHYYAFPANPARFYKGKNIQISGTVTIYRGSPQIILNNKNQIKIIQENGSQ